MPAVLDIWTSLQQRARSDAGAPLVTYVDAAAGERTELSAISLANAAAKIGNALREEFDLEPGGTVGLHVPLHWQRAAWLAGAWTAGCLVLPEGVDADLIISGPPQAADLASAGRGEIGVVSLHPFGLPLTDELPRGAFDVTLPVRQQPDAFLFEPPGPDSAALALARRILDHAALLERAADRGQAWGLADGGRLLVDEQTDPVDAWLACLAVPLACRASVVLVAGDGAVVADQERITAHAVPRPT